ncbi:MAG: hypothetical protein Q9190_001704 [Brigantiaea leucoxantha]
MLLRISIKKATSPSSYITNHRQSARQLHTLLRPIRNPQQALPTIAGSITSHPTTPTPIPPVLQRSNPYSTSNPTPAPKSRSSNKSPLEDTIDELNELYATAVDEFEIASEETDKKSVYAEDDRKAAREEFEKFKDRYEKVIQAGDGEGNGGLTGI